MSQQSRPGRQLLRSVVIDKPDISNILSNNVFKIVLRLKRVINPINYLLNNFITYKVNDTELRAVKNTTLSLVQTKSSAGLSPGKVAS